MKRPLGLHLKAAIPVAAAGIGLLPAAAGAHTLRYSTARAAVQKRANAVAHQPVRLSLVRSDDHAWLAHGSWVRVDPTGCKQCANDPVTNEVVDGPLVSDCYIDLRVGYVPRSSFRVVTVVTGRFCS